MYPTIRRRIVAMCVVCELHELNLVVPLIVPGHHDHLSLIELSME